jgi:putative peptidoglycan lipid II flippase
MEQQRTDSQEEHRLTRHASRVAFGTALSRILGFLRDMMVAYAFGAGLWADCFYAAYRIPNLLRRLLGEGSVSASFIPVLSQYVKTRSKEETQEFINSVFTTLSIILFVLTILGILFSKQLVGIIAWGYTADPEKYNLTVTLTQLMFPFLLMISMAALLLGILNTFNSFFIPAIAPATLSVAEICFILIATRTLSIENQIKGLAIAVVVGGLGQFLLQLPKMKSLGWKLNWQPNFRHPGLKKVGSLITPAVLGLSVDQINAFIDTMCASFLIQGSMTALYYSNRVMQLPLAIFGLAIASVSLPTMSKAAALNDMAKLKQILNSSIRLTLFIIVPAATAFVIMGLPIIRLLFERGNFDLKASLLTNQALIFYSIGLPAFSIVKIAAYSFYSLQETKTPVHVAIYSVLLNALLILLLMKPMGVGGLALATSVASYFNAFTLLIILRKRIGMIGLRKILASLTKVMTGVAVMSAVIYYISYKLLILKLYFRVPLAIVAGVLVYFLMANLLQIEERKPILAIVLREKPTLGE